MKKLSMNTVSLGQPVLYGKEPAVIVDIDYDENDVKIADNEIDCGQWVKASDLRG